MTSFTPTPWLLVASLISLALSLLIWRKRAPGLALLMFSSSLWLFAYALELGSLSLSAALFWARVQYLGIVLLPLSWLIFATKQADWQIPRWGWAVLSLFPFVTLLIVWTNGWHGLFWISAGFDGERLSLIYGPWFWLHTSYSYLLSMLGFTLLLKAIWQKPQRYEGHGWALTLGLSLPFVANVTYVLGISSFDFSPGAAALGALFLAWGVFREQLFDVVPTARSAVLNSMSDGVLVTDKTGKIVDLNPAAVKFLLWDRKRILGLQLQTVYANWIQGFETSEELKETNQVIVAGERFYRLKTEPLLRAGQRQGQVVLIRDVTSKVRVESELRQAKEAAEAASVAKTEFLASMSHELRTPLTAIIGFSELLSAKLVGPLSETQLSYARDIQSSSWHLLDLIDDILNYVALESDSVELKPTQLDITALLEELAENMRARISQNDNVLKLGLEKNLGMLYSDGKILRLVLHHLLDNAAKFTQRGKITLSAQRLKGDMGGQVVFRVTDTGVGIAPEKLTNIFAAFTQADGSNTRSYGGSGLGLSLCKRFSQLLGGEISVQTVLGQGSSFTLRLPLAASASVPILETATGVNIDNV